VWGTFSRLGANLLEVEPIKSKNSAIRFFQKKILFQNLPCNKNFHKIDWDFNFKMYGLTAGKIQSSPKKNSKFAYRYKYVLRYDLSPLLSASLIIDCSPILIKGKLLRGYVPNNWDEFPTLT